MSHYTTRRPMVFFRWLDRRTEGLEGRICDAGDVTPRWMQWAAAAIDTVNGSPLVFANDRYEGDGVYETLGDYLA